MYATCSPGPCILKGMLIRDVVVSKAFQVLSDADKKAKFDRFGGDPDSRFPGASAGGGGSGFGNFNRASSGGAQRQGPMWEEEISPEEMFRQFFGGGMGGGFGGGGPFGMPSTYRQLQACLLKEGVG